MKQILKINLLVVFLLTAMSFTYSQTVHELSNTGPDVIKQFIENTSGWAAGDVLLLTGSSYSESAAIGVSQSLTIKGDPNLSSSPEINFNSPGFDVTAEQATLILENLRLNGVNSTDSSLSATIVSFDGNSGSAFGGAIFKDVEAWGFIQAFRGNTTVRTSVYDKVSFENCILHDFGGTEYIIDPRLNYIKLLEVKNSTIYNINGGIITNLGFQDAGNNRPDLVLQDLVIDQCTFYNLNLINGRSFIQMNDPKDGSIEVFFTNNIVSTLGEQSNSRPFRLGVLAGTYKFENSAFHDFKTARSAAGQTNEGESYNLNGLIGQSHMTVTSVDTASAAPGFKDLATIGSYNFELPEGSSLLTASKTGGPIGDPRWNGGSNSGGEGGIVFGDRVHMIPNTDPDSLEHFIENLSYWNPGDTILLTSPGTYVVTNVIDVMQDAVIMGDPNLSVLPTLKCEDNGFRVKGDSIGVLIKNIRMDGYKTSGGNANYVLYFDQFAGNKWNDIILEDVEAFGFVGGVQLSAFKHRYYKSVKLNRVFFHDINVNTKSWALEPYQNVVENLEITNSTFANIFGILKNVEPDATNSAAVGFKIQNILIYRNTFYNVAGDGGALVQMNDPIDGSVVLNMSKNIVSTLNNAERARPFLLGPNAGTFSIKDNGIHNFRSSRIDNGVEYNLDYLANQSNVTVADTLSDDPQFVKTDTVPYNFSVPLTSVYLGYGDPRWQGELGVSISPLTSSLMVGKTATLTANVTLAPDADKTVTWSVVDGTGSATIDATTGVLTAVSAGTVTVTATSKHDASYTDDLEITIEAEKLVSSINLVGKNAFLTETNVIDSKGGSLTVFATVFPADAADKTITWSFSDTNLVEVQSSDNGKVVIKALASGTVTVTATANDASGTTSSFDVELKKQRPVTDITVSAAGDVNEIVIGETLQMSAAILPEDADVKDVKWSVDKSNIATISTEGILTAVAAGVVTVKASALDDSFEEATLKITVKKDEILGTPQIIASLYPNPVVDFVNINIEGRATVQVLGLSGKVFLTSEVEQTASFNISQLKSGVYVLRLIVNDKVENIKFVKQ